ncbi:hypothetical protein CROQUDRAFT_80848 [Cronartium quercuum f. sp. fusiforme G11]|uniref:Uncharacterized protein n=1 Tax=Cronartium quercuum f. sp. fusiforme G11 TaxID=708437 RepID=A0A9P6NCZ7_9BASI|nr:hypothetical protein CROQUDRAFT_80848 [Cronartium quercuum f. sp. fusiforme G11]
MFQSFQQGQDRIGSEHEESHIRPGRFRAYVQQLPNQHQSSHQSSRLRPTRSVVWAPVAGPSSPASPLTHHPASRLRKPSLTSIANSQTTNATESLLRPGKERVLYWLDTWLRRSFVLVLLPCALVWIWCIIPFPVSDPYSTWPRWNWPLPHLSNSNTNNPNNPSLPPDYNFYFFVLFYFGFYLFIGLMFITKLFDLYRLNWWPKKLGATFTYLLTWTIIIGLGVGLRQLNFINGYQSRKGKEWNYDWERKTVWVILEFFGMMMPIFACFLKLKGDRRGSYRRSMTETQKTFLEHVLGRRIPYSYIRFLWFLTCLFIAIVSLIIGQGFASIYLSTLPHTSLDGLYYVWSWTITLQILNGITCWILESKIRSKALLFVFKYYFILTYFIFYRNLFARLKDPSQYLTVQILSSSWILIYYPISMSKFFFRFYTFLFNYGKTYPEHLETVAHALYIRNLAENVTMLSFLGWLTILHFGPNSNVYPFFKFENPDKNDPYTYRLTITASLCIWTIELVSSFLARALCWIIHKVHITNVGLSEFRNHPELVPACIITSVHVLSDMLLVSRYFIIFQIPTDLLYATPLDNSSYSN